MAKAKGFVVRLDEETMRLLDEKAQRENIERAVLARQYIERSLATDLSTNQRDMMELMIREAVTSVMRPQVERLAKLASKAGIMSASGFFVLGELIASVFGENVDVEELLKDSRRKGVAYVRDREE